MQKYFSKLKADLKISFHYRYGEMFSKLNDGEIGKNPYTFTIIRPSAATSMNWPLNFYYRGDYNRFYSFKLQEASYRFISTFGIVGKTSYFSFELKNSLYEFGKSTYTNFWFTDFDVKFFIDNDRWDVGMSGKNIFGKEVFVSENIFENGFYSESTYILPAYLMLYVVYNF